MRILVFAEYIFAGRWHPDAWVAQVCSALRERGHDVTLACDGGRDLTPLAPCGLLVRRPLRTWRASSSLAFHRWAGRIAAAAPHDASLSFTALAPADATLPLGGPRAILRMLTATANPIAAGLELLHQPWLPVAAAIEAAQARSAPGIRLRIGLSRDGDSKAAIGYGSRLPWAGDSPREQRLARSRVRGSLGIGPRRPLILLSAVHPRRPGLEPMLRALAEARAEARPALAPLALVVGRNGYSVHAAAARAGCPDAVRVLGGTDRMADVLDACDLTVLPGAARAEGTGRLAADALRRGRPVLADRDAPGAALLEPGPDNGYSSPGLVVERRTAAAWRDAFATALNENWLERAAPVAAGAGRPLSLDALAARLEGVLERASARRRGEPAR